ncbi:hypothetical protein ABW16_21450 [Mycolicibacter heraklionensis]|uniref:Uncharacterized protein n=1 Tax=Mycolicibacter heraklionensis TaxID=512402 RepID=A0ABR5FA10_9MYCO|nr:hypothetical protein [Mycolicibacter heraklionensis]KLO25882.1 hypothetical protein ABW16_21450 [Mycolicibacter heraklionensis]
MATDFTARITEILREYAYPAAPTHVANLIAQAAEEHYRPRIETVEQLDALPFLAIIRETNAQRPSDIDYGAVWERRASGWKCIAGVGGEFAAQPQLGCVVLWSPGAGE